MKLYIGCGKIDKLWYYGIK